MLEAMVMIQAGRVVNGKVVVDDDMPLPEGALVGVVIGDLDDDAAELTPEQEELIAQSLEEIKRGEVISGEDFLAKLRSMR
jgi:hypothetical protein